MRRMTKGIGAHTLLLHIMHIFFGSISSTKLQLCDHYCENYMHRHMISSCNEGKWQQPQFYVSSNGEKLVHAATPIQC